MFPVALNGRECHCVSVFLILVLLYPRNTAEQHKVMNCFLHQSGICITHHTVGELHWHAWQRHLACTAAQCTYQQNPMHLHSCRHQLYARRTHHYHHTHTYPIEAPADSGYMHAQDTKSQTTAGRARWHTPHISPRMSHHVHGTMHPGLALYISEIIWNQRSSVDSLLCTSQRHGVAVHVFVGRG